MSPSTEKTETGQFVPLSPGTRLGDKLLYHEDKRYLDILEVFNLSFIYSIFSVKFLTQLIEEVLQLLASLPVQSTAEKVPRNESASLSITKSPPLVCRGWVWGFF